MKSYYKTHEYKHHNPTLFTSIKTHTTTTYLSQFYKTPAYCLSLLVFFYTFATNNHI